ncbi:MAG: hypothetical protein HYX85_03055 [Chloroflexi bacterium]|nr:hypothetical protein [Chloroflexota bacterium]
MLWSPCQLECLKLTGALLRASATPGFDSVSPAPNIINIVTNQLFIPRIFICFSWI